MSLSIDNPNYFVSSAALPSESPSESTSDSTSDSTSTSASESVSSPSVICFGTGRFLRSVFVPAILEGGYNPPIMIQTRGRTFLEYMKQQNQRQQREESGKEESDSKNKINNNDDKDNNDTNRFFSCYEVDTKLSSGNVETDYYPIAAAFSLGRDDDKDAMYQHGLPQLLSLTKNSTDTDSTATSATSNNNMIEIIGVGVTEAGLSSKHTSAMKNLYQLLSWIKSHCPGNTTTTANNDDDTVRTKKLCIIDMDNVPNNGSKIQSYMEQIALEDNDDDDDDEHKQKLSSSSSTMTMTEFISNKVVFLNTMVDRITSQRIGSNGLVPYCEPLPTKALVILDPIDDLMTKNNDNDHTNNSNNAATTTTTKVKKNLSMANGVWIRTTTKQLQQDVHYKLCIANGTHTAIAHILALTKQLETTSLSSSSLLTSKMNSNDGIGNNDEDKNNIDDGNGSGSILMKYLESLVQEQIIPSIVIADADDDQDDDKNDDNNNDDDDKEEPYDEKVTTKSSLEEDVQLVWEDWKQRLLHPHFGLSSFFITQNGLAKGGIRWGPTIKSLIWNNSIVKNNDDDDDDKTKNTNNNNKNIPIQMSFAIAYALLLRWLTPIPQKINDDEEDDDNNNNDGTDKNTIIYIGWLDGTDPTMIKSISGTEQNVSTATTSPSTSTTVTYADGLRYNLQDGWYEFKCPTLQFPKEEVVVADDENNKTNYYQTKENSLTTMLQEYCTKLLLKSSSSSSKKDDDDNNNDVDVGDNDIDKSGGGDDNDNNNIHNHHDHLLLDAIKSYLIATNGGNLYSSSTSTSSTTTVPSSNSSTNESFHSLLIAIAYWYKQMILLTTATTAETTIMSKQKNSTPSSGSSVLLHLVTQLCNGTYEYNGGQLIGLTSPCHMIRSL